MRRTLLVAATTLALLVVGAGTALADYPPGPNGGPTVAPVVIAPEEIVRAPGSLAFTGTELAVLLAVVVGFLAVGVMLLRLARRTASTD